MSGVQCTERAPVNGDHHPLKHTMAAQHPSSSPGGVTHVSSEPDSDSDVFATPPDPRTLVRSCRANLPLQLTFAGCA
jgi:hypothetical protein